MLMPPVSRFMTRQPWTLPKEATFTEALRLMHTKHIRHVPVLEDGKLLGIVSERDLHVVEALSRCNPDEVCVHEAMIADVYTVTEDDSLDEIVDAMVERRCGSAIILDRDHHVTGIFTATDAMRVLGEVLRRATD